ncbi:sulfite oxidase homolog [hydrothermal vent metagenome]|uniref:Sulfite oxidase homolog n=1 Tax=hydrothermal vent metagenome TaxID=652676 RepID=A0A3B1DGL2_9ZZZZ
MTQNDPKYQSGDAPDASQYADDVIMSKDVFRENRMPPGQTRTRKWPVLHATTVPTVSIETWNLEINGLVETPLAFNWEQFQKLPRVKVFADFHCVTTWSRLGNLWEGVSVKEILNRVQVQAEAKYVILGGYDGNWTTNLPLEDFYSPDALLCDVHDGEPIDADHGGPVRMIVPLLYAWKSAKWLKSITFVSDDCPGFWERNGYHNHGDPWVQNSNHPDGERFHPPSYPSPSSQPF